VKTIFIILAILSSNTVIAEINSERLKIIGAITKMIANKPTGIVVMKDTKTKKTMAVELGKTFTIEDSVYQLTSSDGKLFKVTGGDQTIVLVQNPDEFSPPAQIQEETEFQYTASSDENMQYYKYDPKYRKRGLTVPTVGDETIDMGQMLERNQSDDLTDDLTEDDLTEDDLTSGEPLDEQLNNDSESNVDFSSPTSLEE
jgi:hypothetical protein